MRTLWLIVASALSSPLAYAQDPPTEAPAEEAAACPQRVYSADLAAEIDVAENAWVDVAVEDFVAGTDQMKTMIPCLDDELIRPMAARVHRFQGLRRFLDKDRDGSRASFAAARSVEPGYRFPTTLVTAGNPVLEEYGAVDVKAATFAAVPAPAQGRIQMNGELTLQRPTQWPTIVQLLDKDGSVTYTGYLEPADPMPPYEPLPEGMESQFEYDAPQGSARVPLLAVAGVSLAAAGGLQIVALGAKSKWGDIEGTSVDDLDRLRDQANTMQTAAIGAGVVALGLGTGAMLVGSW